jgi:putative lipoprotein
MQARMRYALRARITNIEQLQFTNTEYIDPFSGNPVEVMVQMVSRSGGAPARELETSRWGLETLAGEPAAAGMGGRQVDLEFSKEDSRVGGFAGCNRFNGSYSREGAQEHGAPLSFGEHMAVTMMACPEGMELEQQYLKMLVGVTAFRLSGDILSLLAGPEVVATYRAL